MSYSDTGCRPDMCAHTTTPYTTAAPAGRALPGCYGTDGEAKVHGSCVCSMPGVTATGRETAVEISEDRCQEMVDRTPGTQQESKDVDAMKAAGPVLGDPASQGALMGRPGVLWTHGVVAFTLRGLGSRSTLGSRRGIRRIGALQTCA